MGVCVPGCNCGGCEDDAVCNDESLTCIESACDLVSCNTGTHGAGGACVDDCHGAMCPGGAACVAGMCEPASGLGFDGNGGDGDGDGDPSGFDPNNLGDGDGDGSGDGDPSDGPSADPSGGNTVGSGGADTSAKGCGCRTIGGTTSGYGFAAGLLLAAAFIRRRRR
jgi:MYXO-CTERM domain-containing protein